MISHCACIKCIIYEYIQIYENDYFKCVLCEFFEPHHKDIVFVFEYSIYSIVLFWLIYIC